MTKEDLEVKILALAPDKEYIIVVGKKSGLSMEDLVQIVTENKKIIFLKVKDINQIALEELDDLKQYIETKKKR